MPRKSELPLDKKRLVQFVLGDIDVLNEFYPEAGGYGVVVRALVHQHVQQLRESASRAGAIGHVGTSSTSRAVVDALISAGTSDD